MQEQTEKRRYQRVETHVPLKCGKLRDGSNCKGENSITKDLSLGGMSFRTDNFIPMANRLIVEISLPEKTKSIKAISKIAWIKKSRSGNGYETGNQFLEMSKEDKDSVADYINNIVG
ncbi:MAG: PilZ domain-containing protein [Candidatus Omnitrophota bacterium]